MSTSNSNPPLISSSSLKRPSSTSAFKQLGKRQNRSTTPTTSPEEIMFTSSDSEEEDAKPRKKLDKGKGKAKYLPELPGEVWRQIFQIFNQTWQDAWDNGVSHSPVARSALTPLLISKELTTITLPLLYHHPHLSFTTIPLFLQSLSYPSRYAQLAKRAYVSSLTIKPSPHVPGTQSHPKGSALMPDGIRTGIPYTIHPEFEAVLRNFPDLQSFTLKDTLVLHRADANRLFEALKTIKPKKARLEFRMWNLYESPVGEDILAVSGPSIYSTMLPPPAIETSAIDGLGNRPQYTWRDALHRGHEWELPTGWFDSGSWNTPNPPVHTAAHQPHALSQALLHTDLPNYTPQHLSPSAVNTSSATASSSTAASVMGRRHAFPRSHLGSHSLAFGSHRSRTRQSVNETQSQVESEADGAISGQSEIPHTPLHARYLRAQADLATTAVPGATTNAITLSDFSDDEDDESSVGEITRTVNIENSFSEQPAANASNHDVNSTPDTSTRANACAKATTDAGQRSAGDLRARTRDAWMSKHRRQGSASSFSSSLIPWDQRTHPQDPPLDLSALPPPSQVHTSPSQGEAGISKASSTTPVPRPWSRDALLSTLPYHSASDLAAIRDFGRRLGSYREHTASSSLPSSHRSLDSPRSAEAPQPSGFPLSLPAQRLRLASNLTMVNPEMEEFYTAEAGATGISLAHDMRHALGSLITGYWEGRLSALSLVALDPPASVVFRAPRLDLWTQLAVPHIRVHLPRGIHSLAVLKGAKEVMDDHRRLRRDPNDPPTPPHKVRIVGGDGQGGDLLHDDIRLFEIEVNTIAEMRDEQWLRYGHQIPPQVCRILIGDQDWRAVRVGPDHFVPTTPGSIDVTPDRSPVSSQFNSPTFSFRSLDSDEEEDHLATGDFESEGDTYDSEAAEAQAKRIAERQAARKGLD